MLWLTAVNVYSFLSHFYGGCVGLEGYVVDAN